MSWSASRASSIRRGRGFVPNHWLRPVPAVSLSDFAGMRGPASSSLVVTVALRDDVALVSIAARRSVAGPLSDRVRAVFGVPLPNASRRTTTPLVSIVSVGPQRWLCVAEGRGGRAFEQAVREAIGE